MKGTITYLLVLFSFIMHAQIVNIPDTNFKSELIADGIDTNNDGDIQVSEAEAIPVINVSNESISDLTGIEAFTNLVQLNIFQNNLTAIDLSNNIQLEILECAYNDLTALNLTNNTSLTYAWLQNNQLTELDVSNNLGLEHLIFDSNNITTIDVSMLTQLIELSCINTQLTALNLSNNSMLEEIYCGNNSLLTILNIQNGSNANISEDYFQAEDNPNLSCIQVDDATWSTTNWTNVDDTVSFDEYCGQTYVPDDNFENYLETHDGIGGMVSLGDPTSLGNGIANDNYVFTDRVNIAVYLLVSDLSINDLTGIEEFFALEVLYCYNNNLSELDISNNTVLVSLSCYLNNLTSLDIRANTALSSLHCYSNNLDDLDVSTNIALEVLSCFYNNISSLDLSANTALTRLWCQNNQLTSLDIRNEHNNLIDTDDFKTTGNADLTCINVDNTTWSTTNWTYIDTTSSFDEHCGETYIPDDNFEQALIDLGYDDVIDDYIITSNINSITSLNVSNKNIANLTGIEDFVALTSLNCNYNSLTSLDIAANTALSTLRCSNNDLTDLDITNNTSLTFLDFSSNSIDEIDISINTALYGLKCSSNLLTTIDMSTNINLTMISAGFNPLSNFDISTNINLEQLYCNNLNLSSLDISNNLDLEWLRCQNNNLTDLDLSDFENLTILDCSNNNLTNLNIQNGNNTAIIEERFHTSGNPDLSCIFVDDISYSTTTWTDIDTTSTFVETQAECDTALSISSEEFELAITLFPNPVTNLLTIKISNDIQLEKVSLFDIMGKQISIEENSTTISLKHLPAGVYFIKLQDVGGTSITKKIIKK